MAIYKSGSFWASAVANAADLCMKPFKHAVVLDEKVYQESNVNDDTFELILRIESRTIDGKRLPENDIDIEIFASGPDYNLMLSWSNHSDRPILWQGKHCVWMDPDSGKRCTPPDYGDTLQTLGRRLKMIFSSV